MMIADNAENLKKHHNPLRRANHDIRDFVELISALMPVGQPRCDAEETLNDLIFLANSVLGGASAAH